MSVRVAFLSLSSAHFRWRPAWCNDGQLGIGGIAPPSNTFGYLPPALFAVRNNPSMV
jgi:hypothetical protein